MLQIHFKLHSIKMSDSVIAPFRRTKLGDATIHISVRRGVQVNVDGIIDRSQIRKRLHSSMDFRISHIRMLFHFDNLDFNNFISIRFSLHFHIIIL